jgi:hypothetical protein
MRVGIGQFLLLAEWAIEPHPVALLVANSVGQSAVTNFQPVTDQFQFWRT